MIADLSVHQAMSSDWGRDGVPQEEEDFWDEARLHVSHLHTTNIVCFYIRLGVQCT